MHSAAIRLLGVIQSSYLHSAPSAILFSLLSKKFTAVKFKCLLVTNDEMRDHIFEQSSTVQSSAKGGALDSLEHLEEVLLLKYVA
nr:proteinaceous RNase P 1, chloroplastic/mitochondrial [Ipomoea batatas]